MNHRCFVKCHNNNSAIDMDHMVLKSLNFEFFHSFVNFLFFQKVWALGCINYDCVWIKIRGTQKRKIQLAAWLSWIFLFCLMGLLSCFLIGCFCSFLLYIKKCFENLALSCFLRMLRMCLVVCNHVT
jgi:hypothetical protein